MPLIKRKAEIKIGKVNWQTFVFCFRLVLIIQKLILILLLLSKIVNYVFLLELYQQKKLKN